MAIQSASKKLVNLVKLRSVPILQQLLIEERLLRTNQSNWCIINDGTDPAAIVMGISGEPHNLLHLDKVMHDNMQVIKRFSGGGTVIVDQNTIFVTFICCGDAIQGLSLFPRPIMQWTEKYYSQVFKETPHFRLLEHDYVFGELKFGGNAQSIVKDRWLHHTSFLWDFCNLRMSYLKMPKRAPSYRAGRAHSDFVCKLQEQFPSREVFLNSVEMALSQWFDVKETSLAEAACQGDQTYKGTTRLFSHEELAACLKLGENES
ncbi:hypothetical protein KP509_09G052000 [Ceratopteris richardii]|uniref:BPL/LPL catalytic domain-containing protein n=1 Tax=Ceratopteris richardii TaxID=49495 RepID=A0A8T2U456_CERRI|nr:hypothetical protein KP509_09G052000 [Ceratopteris richardii]